MFRQRPFRGGTVLIRLRFVRSLASPMHDAWGIFWNGTRVALRLPATLGTEPPLDPYDEFAFHRRSSTAIDRPQRDRPETEDCDDRPRDERKR